jgi:putative ABC transport system permease protein
MYQNLFKIIFRNLWKYKTYTLINLIGMGIGIAALVWAFILYRYSFSFDSFHKERHTVYRTVVNKKDAEGLRGLAPMPVVVNVKNDFSGVINAARWDSRGLSITSGNGNVFVEDAHFTDPSFFSMFQFPLVAGSSNLSGTNSVLITETTAKKYFGNENALGKTLTFYAGESYALPLTVTGILKDPPTNSTIHFRFITNFDNCYKADGTKIAADDWGWFLDAAFFQIPDAANAARIERAMNKYNALQNKVREDWQVASYKLMTMAENARLSGVLETNSLFERPHDSAAYGTIVLAILIFLSACLNFSNTTVARANRRLKEIGIRKVMGSTYAQLMKQLLVESGVIMLAAIFISLIMNKWWFPVFNSMFRNIKLEANYLSDAGLLLFLLIILLFSTLMAGAYPAFYMSRFNASSIFRGNVKFGGTNLFSRLMLGLQLSIAIITVIAGVAFSNNASFQRNYDYGYDIENSIGLIFNDSSAYNALKNEINKIPEVTSSAGTRSHIFFDYRSPTAESEGMKKEIRFMEVGDAYVKTMQLKVNAGRDFNAASEADYKDALLITQKMAAEFGWSEQQSLGKKVRIDSISYSVVGVLKDFQMQSLFNPLEPVALRLGRENQYQFLIIQAKPQDLTTVYAKANDTWKRLFPLKPFNAFYQNEVAAETYKITTNIAIIFKWFAIVSILLTATGLFALVSLTTLKKMKEIALRKVSGANASHILVLINKGYFWIFIVAAIFGCAGGWALTKLLLGLIFKIHSGVSVVTLVASVSALFIIAATVTGVKVWQAVRTNPVKLLRAE